MRELSVGGIDRRVATIGVARSAILTFTRIVVRRVAIEKSFGFVVEMPSSHR